MNKEMSLMGVGGKIAIVLVGSLVFMVVMDMLLGHSFRIARDPRQLLIIGFAVAWVGFTLNLVAALGMMKAHGKGELATKGLYSVFLHPMYAFQILVTIPGLLLLFNSWLIMVVVIPAFIAFKVFAKEEERYLEDKFGDQYKVYRERVVFKFL